MAVAPWSRQKTPAPETSEEIIFGEKRRQAAIPRTVVILQHLFGAGIAAGDQFAQRDQEAFLAHAAGIQRGAPPQARSGYLQHLVGDLVHGGVAERHLKALLADAIAQRLAF